MKKVLLMACFVLLWGCSTGKNAAYYGTLKEAVKAGPGLIEKDQAELKAVIEKMTADDVITLEHVGKDHRPRVHIKGSLFVPFLYMMARIRTETPGEYTARVVAAIPHPGPTAGEILARGVAGALPMAILGGTSYGIAVSGFNALGSIASQVGPRTDNRSYENSFNSFEQRQNQDTSGALEVNSQNPISTVTEMAPAIPASELGP